MGGGKTNDIAINNNCYCILMPQAKIELLTVSNNSYTGNTCKTTRKWYSLQNIAVTTHKN